MILMSKIKIFLKRVSSYSLWHFFISNYQSIKFLLFKNYSARGNIDKDLISIIDKKKRFLFGNRSI